MEEFNIRELLSVVHRRVRPEEAGQSVSVQRQEDLLVYVLNGEVEYCFAGESLNLQAGDLLLLPRAVCYRRRFTDLNYQAVFVYCRFSEAPVPEYRVFRKWAEEHTFIRLYKIWRSQGVGAHSECLGLLYQVYARLLRTGQTAYLPSEKRLPMETLAQKIAESYTEPELSVSALAEESGMSEVHFRRCFEALYQCSPLDYILNLRICRAKELLRYHGGPVKEIARVCGFADPSYFSRLFKKKTGHTPSEYRRLF